MQKIPVSTDAYSTFKVLLNDQLVNIDLRWQDISSSWFISIYDQNATYIQNKRLVENTYILSKFPLPGFDGAIIAVSQSEPLGRLGRDSFNSEYELYYLTREELNGL
jgi:hypothetical protein